MDQGFCAKYARCITRHPYLVLLLVILVSVFAVQMALTVETKMFVVKDLLPQDEEVMSTLEIFEDNFGNVDTVFFAVAIDPSHQGSNEVRDIRDARVVRYLDQLSELALHTEDVIEVRSPSHILRSMNDGRLPPSTREVQELSHKNGLFTGYFSQDHDLARVTILISDEADLKELETELTKVLAQVPRPSGVKVSLGGTAIESMVMEKTIPTDMARTTTASLLGIVVIVLVLFRSVKYGFLPLSAIAFGSIWAMGFVGLIGMELSAATAGVLSIIMGIGIDFGIQVATRYRLELHTKEPEEAMEQTLSSVIFPMSITASAAIIGFQAMSLGRLVYLGEMGSIMSYGVAASMIAALTAVPALIIIIDTMNMNTTMKRLRGMYMNRIRKTVPVVLLIAVLSVMIHPALAFVPENRIAVHFMSQDPDPADAGKDIDLRWQVVNKMNDPVDHLKFRLEADYPFQFEAGDTPDKELGPSARTNDEDVFYVLHYKLRVADTAVEGTYDVTLRWNTGSGWIEQDFPVYIDPKQPDFVVGALDTSPEKLKADTEEATVSVSIDNIGTGSAENVKAKLHLPDGFTQSFSYSDEDSLGTIGSGMSKTADFTVDIDEGVKPGEHPAQLEISYKDENDGADTYRTKTLDIVIPVKPAPYLVIDSVETTPERLVPGSKARVLLKVRNTGNEDINAVSLRVFRDASQPFAFNEKSDFIGKLGPDDSGDAVIRFDIETHGQVKKHLLDVELRGIDKSEDVLIFRRTVPLTIQEKEPGISAGWLAAAVLGICAFGTVIFLKKGRSVKLRNR